MDRKYAFCVIGSLSPRQKIMTARLLLALDTVSKPAVAMDTHNAQVQGLLETAEKVIVFRPHADSSESDVNEVVFGLMSFGWDPSRILVEGKDFRVGLLPNWEEVRNA